MKLTFLGQSGFVVEDGRCVVIDPFLGELEDPAEQARFPRAFPPPMTVADLPPPDVVLVSHHHGDHCHVPTLMAILANAPDCMLVTTPSSRDCLTAAGVPPARLVVPEPSGWLSVNGVRLFVVPAAHYEFSYRPDARCDFFGFVIDLPWGRIYSAGDTIAFDGLSALIESLALRLALLPVNGRDARREALGIIGNLTPEEAAMLTRASALQWVVPCHFDMFATNTADMSAVADVFARECPGAEVWIPTAGLAREFPA